MVAHGGGVLWRLGAREEEEEDKSHHVGHCRYVRYGLRSLIKAGLDRASLFCPIEFLDRVGPAYVRTGDANRMQSILEKKKIKRKA